MASLSSACGAHDYRCYADKTGDGYVPTVFPAACMHGGVFEGTVALMNLISLLETGTDLAGRKNDEALSLAKKLHLVLMPMCNPDGRCHVPFDNFVGHTFHDLRYYGQGTWKNGEPCVTYESNQGLTECEDLYCLTNDEIYRSHFIYLEVLFDWVLKNKNAEKQHRQTAEASLCR